MDQAIVLGDGTVITGAVVSWEGDGMAVVKVHGHRYYGERAECHARRVAAGLDPVRPARPRHSIPRQLTVVGER